ncbi:hypothetical protein [Caulobacter sp. 17J65-9]|uniref:hypothetical protein n=1 Tax=Caulobacter sp. 17J65-9 TaxID=2709382 RepID=UPI0013C61923|nr:hypothetical protein [Caulobacter sp. 17J65-9]NEX92905.1 hypothetical protein [Caulobacter sp. 17J65-9]
MNLAARLAGAFPAETAGLAHDPVRMIVEAGATLSPDSFDVSVAGRPVSIPERLYVDAGRLPRPSRVESGVLACLLTRHHDGYVRQRALDSVLASQAPWAAPFIVRLIGEYVVEILDEIEAAFEREVSQPVREFVAENPEFVRLTKARVESYWDCYHRHIPRETYAGFKLLARLERAGAA